MRIQSGAGFAILLSVGLDVTFGRWLAFVRHPQAAWRRLDSRHRAALVGAYAGIGYIGTLALMVALG